MNRVLALSAEYCLPGERVWQMVAGSPFAFCSPMFELLAFARRLILATIVFTGVTRATDVLSYHNDAPSTGQNLSETSLTPTSVSAGTFSRRFLTAVDGQVYAQPLYKAGVDIVSGPNAGLHDLVFVATQHDSIYAIDANSGAIVWQTALLTSAGLAGATSVTPMPQADTDSGDITPEAGIISTPVIDAATNRLYVEAKFKEIVNNDTVSPHYVQGIFVLDITNGNSTANANIVTSNLFSDTVNVNGTNDNYTYRANADASAVQDPFVFGTGYSNEVSASFPGRVYFNSQRALCRAGLILYNGNLYAVFASHGDNGPYHGWMLGFNKTTLALTAALNTTPNGGLGGIWQGGGIPSMDAAGNFYLETGNGSFDTTLNGQGFPINGNYSDCFIKIAVDASTSQASQNQNGWGLKVVDYFAPYNNQTLDAGDTDLGAGGPLVLPDSAGNGTYPHLLVGGGKEGKLYLINRDSMGHFNSNTDNVVQTVTNAVVGILDTPAYFNGMLYFAGGYNNDVGRAFTIGGAQLSTVPVKQTPDTFGFAGSTPSISANGANNGLVWMIDNGSHQLRAYLASDLSNEIYTSNKAGARDQLTGSTKFSVPTVADGHVFVGIGTNNSGGGVNGLAAFGPPVPPTAPPDAPSTLTATAVSGIQIQLSWADNSTNEDGFRVEKSTNGSAFSEIATVGVNAVSYQVTGLQVGTNYSFRVRAYNSFQGLSFSGYSNVASATTSAQSPSIIFANGFVNTGGVNGPLQYNGSAAINGTRLELTNTGATFEAGSVFAKALQDVHKFSTQFTFQLTNAQADGFTFCIQGNAATALGQSGGALGYQGIGKSIAIKFDLFQNTSEGNDSTGLYINGVDPAEVGSVDLTGTGIDLHSGDLFNVALIYDGVTLTETITDTTTNATFSQNYTIDIPGTVGNRAYIGFTGGTGGLLATQDIVTWSYTILPSAPPAAPTFLDGSPASGTEIDLRWSDNSTTESGVVIERSTDGTHFSQIGIAGVNATSFADTGLTPGSAFSYRVYATNSIGNSGYSNVLTMSTPTPPITPSGGHVTNVTTTEIDLAWQDNATDETGYRIQRSSGGANFNTIAMLPPNVTTFKDRNLSPGVTYDYHIQAFNLAGYQDFTGVSQQTIAPVMITANDATVQEGTNKPASFTVTRVGDTDDPLVIYLQSLVGAGQAAPSRYTLSPSANSVTIPVGASSASIFVNPTSDPTVAGTQSITLSVVAGEEYTPGNPSSASIQLLDSPVSQWKMQKFGNLTAAQQPTAADNANPSGDGVSNLMKYALGEDPLVHLSSVPTKIETENINGVSYLCLTIVRPHPAPTGVTYHFESSGDLVAGAWTPAVLDAGYPMDNGNGTETVKVHDSQAATVGSHRFIRLRVTRP